MSCRVVVLLNSSGFITSTSQSRRNFVRRDLEVKSIYLLNWVMKKSSGLTSGPGKLKSYTESRFRRNYKRSTG